jgi:hypothetical protein
MSGGGEVKKKGRGYVGGGEKKGKKKEREKKGYVGGGEKKKEKKKGRGNTTATERERVGGK